MTTFIYSFQSEWLKKKRSLSSVLVIVGACFIPAILLIAGLVRHEQMAGMVRQPRFWEMHWDNTLEAMSLLLFPLGITLAASLVTQLEFRNSTWKQLHTTPQSFTTIFFAKLSVLLAMLLQFFVLFNVAVYVSGVLPALFFSDVAYPPAPFPLGHFLRESCLYFLDCLPIVGLQFLLGLQFRNFLVPIGAGIALWILSAAVIKWEYGYFVPYTFSAYHYIESAGRYTPPVSVHLMAAIYFVVFTLAGYILYVTKREKG